MKGDMEKLPSAVVVICIPVHIYIIFSCLYDPFWVKSDVGTGIHNIMIIHYNCTRQFLFFADLSSFIYLFH